MITVERLCAPPDVPDHLVIRISTAAAGQFATALSVGSHHVSKDPLDRAVIQELAEKMDDLIREVRNG